MSKQDIKIKETRNLAAELLMLCDLADTHSLYWWEEYRKRLQLLSEKRYE